MKTYSLSQTLMVSLGRVLFILLALWVSQGVHAQTELLREFDIPIYPNADTLTVNPSDMVDGAMEFSYQQHATCREVLDFYLRNIPDSKWNVEDIENRSIQSIPLFNVSVTAATENRESLVTLHIVQNQLSPTTIIITHIPELKTLINNRSQSASHHHSQVDSEAAPPHRSDLFPLMSVLERIKRDINAQDYQSVYESGSTYFQRGSRAQVIARALEDIEVTKLVSLYQTQHGDLITAIVEFEIRKKNSRELGYRIMYFRREAEHWKFHNLPISEYPESAPNPHVLFE